MGPGSSPAPVGRNRYPLLLHHRNGGARLAAETIEPDDAGDVTRALAHDTEPA